MSEKDEIEDKLGSIARQVSALQARLEQIREHAKEEAALRTELQSLEQKRRDMAKPRLRLLDRVAIASPCDVPWESMRGDDTVRFCGQCKRNVYDLSAMSEGAAAGFLAQHETNLPCLQFYQRPDGTIVTRDCTATRIKKERTFATVCTVAAVAITGALVSLDGFLSPATDDAEPMCNVSKASTGVGVTMIRRSRPMTQTRGRPQVKGGPTTPPLEHKTRGIAVDLGNTW